MSAQYVQLAPESSGKKVQSYENTVSTQVVEACAASIINPSGYSDSFVRIATDSTGKKIQTFVNTIGVNSVHALACVIVDNTGSSIYG